MEKQENQDAAEKNHKEDESESRWNRMFKWIKRNATLIFAGFGIVVIALAVIRDCVRYSSEEAREVRDKITTLELRKAILYRLSAQDSAAYHMEMANMYGDSVRKHVSVDNYKWGGTGEHYKRQTISIANMNAHLDTLEKSSTSA